MHTIKLLLNYYLNISVQAANLSDCRIESELFCPNWNALVDGTVDQVLADRARPATAKQPCSTFSLIYFSHQVIQFLSFPLFFLEIQVSFYQQSNISELARLRLMLYRLR